MDFTPFAPGPALKSFPFTAVLGRQSHANTADVLSSEPKVLTYILASASLCKTITSLVSFRALETKINLSYLGVGVYLTFFEHLFHPKEHFRACVKVLTLISDRKTQQILNLMVSNQFSSLLSANRASGQPVKTHCVPTRGAGRLCRGAGATPFPKMQIPRGLWLPQIHALWAVWGR